MFNAVFVFSRQETVIPENRGSRMRVVGCPPSRDETCIVYCARPVAMSACMRYVCYRPYGNAGRLQTDWSQADRMQTD